MGYGWGRKGAQMASTPGETAFAEAAAMVSAGNLAGAEAQLRACLSLQPDHQNAELTLANLLIHRQAWLEAEPVLRAHLKRAPTVDGLLMLARVTASTGRPLEAERHHLEVLRHVPTNGPALQAAAEFYSRHKASREAAKYWKRYIDANPADYGGILKYADLIWGDAPDEAISLLERTLEQNADGDLQSLKILEKMIVLKEWHARRQAGLAPYHGKSVDDLHFRFAAADVARFAEIAARAVAATPEHTTARTKQCIALLATGRGHALESQLAPVAKNLSSHTWSNVRDRDGGFYERLSAMTDADILRGLPPVEIARAASFAHEPVAYLSCDFRYFGQFAVPLLRSLAATAPAAQVHIHIMDSPADQIEAAKGLVTSLGLRAAITRETVLPVDQATPELARAYFHAIRFVRFYQHLKQYGRTLWLMDVDGLFNRSPADMYTQIGTADVAMRVRPGRWEPWNQFNACVVGAAPTAASVNYFRLIAAYIAHFHQQKTMRWGIDQLAMYGVYEYLRSTGNAPPVAVLDERAVDYEQTESGILWCNSGFGKFTGREQLACRDPEGAAYADLLARYNS